MKIKDLLKFSKKSEIILQSGRSYCHAESAKADGNCVILKAKREE